MKFYEVIKDLYGAKAGDILIQDNTTTNFYLSKAENEFSDKRETYETVFLMLPEEYVIEHPEYFKEIVQQQAKVAEVEEVKPEPAIAGAVETEGTVEQKVEARLEKVSEVLSTLINLYGPEFEGASDEMLTCIADLQAEYKALEWVLTV